LQERRRDENCSTTCSGENGGVTSRNASTPLNVAPELATVLRRPCKEAAHYFPRRHGGRWFPLPNGVDGVDYVCLVTSLSILPGHWP
jgi:hypothetical protein